MKYIFPLLVACLLVVTTKTGQASERDANFQQHVRMCDMGNPRSCLSAFQLTKDPFLQLELSEKACRIEVGLGCTLAGVAYFEGTGTRKNEQRARALFETACNANERQACLELGYLIAMQATKVEDYRQAMPYFGKACDLKEQLGCTEYAELEKAIDKRARARRNAEEAARAESDNQNRRITNCLAWNFAYPGRPCPFN